MSKILLEYQQKDFKVWAGDPDLATKYITTRSKYPAPYNSWDYWMSKKNNKTPDDLRKYMGDFKSKTQVKKDIKKDKDGDSNKGNDNDKNKKGNKNGKPDLPDLDPIE